MNDYFSFERVVQYFPKIITSFPTTLLIVAVAMAVGTVLGIVLAFIRIHRIPVLYQLSSVYISFIRGTPQIVQLFLVYYGVPRLAEYLLGLNLNQIDALYFVLVAYGLNESAYLAEIFRGGLKSIPVGQYEAGYTVGLTRRQTFIRVIVPQAARVVLPSVGVSLIVLFQDTSMAASVGVQDLMGRAGLMGASTRHYTENYFITAVVFVVVSLLLEFLFHKLNKRIDYTSKEAVHE